MKKLAVALALVVGFYSGVVPAQDSQTITTTSKTVTIGGVTVPVAGLVVGAIVGGLIILAITQSGDETTIVAATTT